MILPILYQDADFVVINKPSGLLVHPTALASGETESVTGYLKAQLNQKVYPVHRLDRPTSGTLILALSSEMAKALSVEFQERRVEKEYLAVVRGVPPQEVLIDHPLKEELDEIADSKARQDKEAQEAITWMQTLGSIEFPVKVDRYPTSRYSLVRARPKTGRKHQVRRHLRHLGHPIIGDVNHGVGKHNRYFAEAHGNRRLLLACTEMSFSHPRSGKKITVCAPLSEDYQNLLVKFEWDHLVTKRTPSS